MVFNDDAIEFEFRLTTDDFFRTFFALNLRRWWFLILMLVFGFGDLYFKIANPNREFHAADLLPVTFLTLFYGYMLVGAPYQSALEMMKNQNFTGPILYRFKDDGFDVIASGSSGHQAWSMVDGIQESSRYILLFAPKNCLHLLPKSAIGGRLSDLKQIFRKRVAKNVKLRN